MTEENKPSECPKWCTEKHAHPDIQIHESASLITAEPSTIVAYAQQTVFEGTWEPAVVKVSVADGPDQRVRLELPPDQARTLGLIIDDAAKSGIKSVRTLGKGLTELAALVSEPEADEPEAGA